MIFSSYSFFLFFFFSWIQFSSNVYPFIWGYMLDNKVEEILCYRFEIFRLLDIVKIKLPFDITYTFQHWNQKIQESRICVYVTRVTNSSATTWNREEVTLSTTSRPRGRNAIQNLAISIVGDSFPVTIDPAINEKTMNSKPFNLGTTICILERCTDYNSSPRFFIRPINLL